MRIEYHKDYSHHLGREMEYKIYGHAGKPLLVLPTQCKRFYEFEENMLSVFAPYIDGGKLQVFAVDGIDWESLAGVGDCRMRICRHEAWMNYLVHEAIPHFSYINHCCNGFQQPFAVLGFSLGALHSTNLFFRYPDWFDTCFGISGLYSTDSYFGDYHDDLTYQNSPEQYIKGMAYDHPYLQKYRNARILLCVGQGAWEAECVESTKNFYHILQEKGVPATLDVWGNDVAHDWY